ncbi:MFS transporter [Acidaminobacter sp. JC074]|uniref:MFS transporter n=1 Tax=Acidaminobacter sp. JC074 TaxID=2530199 RepID=UPI001F0F5556|nr:glycoside-pentoside-hexuronide (GPH):cation symporter [Acidaminobacter sp. JC074]MCH4890173.1 MFS transporter [Acidaminobacter sp. JC074]
MEELKRQEHVAVKLSRRLKLGYGLGSTGEQLAYNVFYIYFMMFLTDVVGIGPASAGLISLMAVVWDGITDPIIGYLSDNSKNPKGRRSPMMLYASIPLGILTFALFTKVNLSESYAIIYYLGINMLFWLFFTMVDIPYLSLGGELTNDFNERTELRGYAAVFFNLGVLIASSGFIIFVDIFMKMTGDTAKSWSYAAMVVAGIIIMSFIITYLSVNKHEPKNKLMTRDKFSVKKIVESYQSVLKIKSYRFIAFTTLFFIIAYSFSTSNAMYFMTYYAKLTPGAIALAFIIISISAAAMSAFVSLLAKRFDKKGVYLTGILIFSLGVFLFRYLDVSNPMMIYVYFLFMGVGSSAFWTLIYAMSYDVSEVEEYKTGLKKQGAIVAFMSFFVKLGTALAMWWIGVYLQKIGYDPTLLNQSDQTVKGILDLQTIYPAVFGLLAFLAMLKYPITRQAFDKLNVALELKKQGKAHSEEDFKHLL